jgi:SNF2 family DNA or RNA helicase
MLRSTTNLVVPEDLQLPRNELKRGFLAVYNKAYPGLEPVFMNRLWLSLFLPEIVQDPSYGKNRKGIRQWAEYMQKHAHAGHLSLKKVNDNADPHFVASIPLFSFARNDAQVMANKFSYWFTDGKNFDSNSDSVNSLIDVLKDTSAPAEELVSKVVPGAQAIPKIIGIDAKMHAELTETLLAVRLVYVGLLAVVMIDFKISKAIAQQLTTTEWVMIRNTDLYPLLLQWVAGQFGFTVDTPLAAFPLSKIAKTLPRVQEGQARVNKDGLAIDPQGMPLWLPEKLDNTSRYEDLFTQAGDNGDGTFSLLKIADHAKLADLNQPPKNKLPANIPVLIDWVNFKYSYTQSNGILKVQNLSRFKAAEPSHIHNLLLRLRISDKQLGAIANIAASVGVSSEIKIKSAELEAIDKIDSIIANKINRPLELEEYWGWATQFFTQHIKDDVVLNDIAVDGEEIFRPVARFLNQARASILTNLDAVNLKYSVAGVSANLGLLTLIKYAGDADVHLAAAAANAAATNQGVDPKWEPPSVPMISDRFGLLPHQKKVRNLLKDSPDFAILPVQAGGGKTPLAILDVCYEIKANRSQPYLILCPSHLVPQYVKELVFFTAGKINVVPINTYVTDRNGFERLTKMLEGAPRNTVVVADYDVLRQKQRQVCYGTTSVTVYPIIEFLRQFDFKYALLDESHFVKNDSQRTRACMALIADIPKKRLASGTMAHDSPSDLAIQISMLDPTLFGSRSDFNNRYGSTVKGDRVIEWKPGAQHAINAAIKTRVVIAKAMRKEWAALLPQAEENFLGVELTPAQQQVYQAILTEALDKMREDAKNNKTLQKFFKSGAQQVKEDVAEGEEADEEEDAADEDAGADLEALLGFYLARLEQYITAPARDPLGDKVLKGDDRRSPKVNMIIERCKLHLDQNLEGKILIFTNYTESAEEIFEAFPDNMKAQALLYRAAEKVEAGNKFENDDNCRIMVGVENSMNTGLNFQYVSRLIRVETVWNPGTLEQGNSRVNRPELKKADRRDRIYYDWIMANKTLDITKISRLISKVIAVAKFENTENAAYEEVPNVKVIAMNTDSIQLMNDWNENLVEYADAYKTYNTIKIEDYREYREKHGELKLEALTMAPTPKDAKLMAEVPYVPGLDIYQASQLGLVRVDEFLRLDSLAGATESEEETEDSEDESQMTEKQKAKRLAAQSLVGQAIHTEFGDGIIKSVMMGEKRVNVALNNGYLVRVAMASSYIITKKTTSGKEIRQQLLEQVGVFRDEKGKVTKKEEPMPTVKPTDIMSPKFRRNKAAERQQEREKDKPTKVVKEVKEGPVLNVELVMNVSNGFLGITYFVEDDNAKAALQALGFRPVPQFALAKVKNARQLISQFKAWEAKGFTLDEQIRKMRAAAAFEDLAVILKSGNLEHARVGFNFATKNQLTNFFRLESKPSASKNEIKPYPMIEDGSAYIVMHTRGQPANLRAMKVKVPGVTWQHGADSMVFYGLDLAHTGQKIKEIQAAGIQIANVKDLAAHFKLLKKIKIRNAEDKTSI